MKKSADSEDLEGEMKEWSDELKTLQDLLPDETSIIRMQSKEIPDLEKQLKEQEAHQPDLADEALKAESDVNALKKELKELASMRQTAQLISRTTRELDDLKRDIETLEKELASSGSTKSVDDVRTEVNELSDKM